MHGGAEADRVIESADGDAPPAGLTAEAIENVLADFRGWLTELAVADEPAAAPAAFDLFSLVSQLAALRHDVTLLTKANRALNEKVAASVAPPAEEKPTVDLRPVVKTLIEIHDALTTALARVQTMTATDDPPLPTVPDELLTLTQPRPVAKPGFMARLFGATPESAVDSRTVTDWLQRVTDAEAARATARKALLDRLAGVADGYAMSVRRVERLLPHYGVEPIVCVGQVFDSERMEAIEVVVGPTPGVVVHEVRRGYRWEGKLFRPAQVAVAR